MHIVTYMMLGFAALAAIDRIFGGKFGIGEEFEKGLMMIGPLTVSMAGMIVMAPVISKMLQSFAGVFPEFIDFSVIPSMVLANDMGGAHLALGLSENEIIGNFNGLVLASMMGCTVSFTVPFVMQVVKKCHQEDVLFGILCGIATVPVGCFVSGLMLKISIIQLVFNLVPVVIFAGLVALGILKAPDLTVKIFKGIGFIIKAVITVGIVVGITEFLTGFEIIKDIGSLNEAMQIIINIMCIMAGAFPLISIMKKVLTKPLKKAGELLRINETAAFGLLATLGTSVTTFEMTDKMDKKGIVLNSAFAVSASFVFVDHLAFTLSFNQGYVAYMVAGKLISGVCAILVANAVYKRRYK